MKRVLPASWLLLMVLVAPSAVPDQTAFDPLAAATTAVGTRIDNLDAGVPPQCYTRTGSRSNPCYACHTVPNGRNKTDDWELQSHYDFSEPAKLNHWHNLFADHRAQIAAIDDAWMLAHIREDNYPALKAAMAKLPKFPGWRPDIDFAAGFDEEGFARDGSSWRAFRYKPFVGTFWPTNGSTDTVLIRLPSEFRSDALGKPSLAVYKANLAILEAATAVPDTVADQDLTRRIEPVDESAVGIDLDGDGSLSAHADRIKGLPAHYVGGASAVGVVRYGYPAGTEFMHPVYYVDPDAADGRALRLKELRYSHKDAQLSDLALQRQYEDEAREQVVGARPYYGGNAFTGQSNEFGWTLQGYIEDEQGRLRLQTREEQLFCMGCHTGLGVTVDNTFSLPRKVPGAAGWGLQRIAGMPDVPTAGTHQPEYERYMARVGAGDEFRANFEMIARFFAGGRLDRAKLARAGANGAGILGIVAPSRERALALDKAYTVVVREQSYRDGRAAVISPAVNVHRDVRNGDTPLKASGRVFKDGRLWLDWDALTTTRKD